MPWISTAVACSQSPVCRAMSTENHPPCAVNNVVIIGGGLGGLSAAIQLRSRGIDAQVYEKNQTISGGEGTLISLFPNGCRALSHANPDLLAKLRNEGITDSESAIVSVDGHRLGEWSLSTQMEQKYGQPMVAIMWKHALRILSESLPDDCKHTGYQCVDITQDDDGGGATVRFQRGEEQVEVKAPLVIGSDGIRSSVRTSLFGLTPPRDNGRTMWRAVIDSARCSHQALLKRGVTSTAAHGRTIFVVNGVQEKLYWAFSVTDEATNGDVKRRSKDGEEMKQRLLEYFRGWEMATEIIQATEPGLILERRVVDFPVPEQWYKGSVVLIGDAVHAVTPSLGQGANMAFEDGLELALQLTSSKGLQSALQNYQTRRLPRAQKISGASQRQGQNQEFYDWLYTYDQLNL